MPGRPARYAVSVGPTPSTDGRWYGRYPYGNKTFPGAALASVPRVVSFVAGALSSGIRLAAAAQEVSRASGALSVGGTLITWTLPTQNADGSTLTDLAGLHVYYGLDSDNLQSVQDVPNPSATSTTLPLTSGHWYIRIKAYDTEGRDSDQFSAVAEKVVP
jgi:hypothetical protein